MHVIGEVVNNVERLGHEGAEFQEAMHHVLRFEQLDRDAKMLQQTGVRDAFVAKRITFGDEHDRRRCAGEVIEHEWRNARIGVITPRAQVLLVVVAKVVELEQVTRRVSALFEEVQPVETIWLRPRKPKRMETSLASVPMVPVGMV